VVKRRKRAIQEAEPVEASMAKLLTHRHLTLVRSSSSEATGERRERREVLVQIEIESRGERRRNLEILRAAYTDSERFRRTWSVAKIANKRKRNFANFAKSCLSVFQLSTGSLYTLSMTVFGGQ